MVRLGLKLDVISWFWLKPVYKFSIRWWRMYHVYCTCYLGIAQIVSLSVHWTKNNYSLHSLLYRGEVFVHYFQGLVNEMVQSDVGLMTSRPTAWPQTLACRSNCFDLMQWGHLLLTVVSWFQACILAQAVVGVHKICSCLYYNVPCLPSLLRRLFIMWTNLVVDGMFQYDCSTLTKSHLMRLMECCSSLQCPIFIFMPLWWLAYN